MGYYFAIAPSCLPSLLVEIFSLLENGGGQSEAVLEEILFETEVSNSTSVHDPEG